MNGSEVLRVAVFGPESTGKSQLAAKLGAHFSAPVVAEYAREFWDAHGAIGLEDMVPIAREQWRREDAAGARIAARFREESNPLDDKTAITTGRAPDECNPLDDKLPGMAGVRAQLLICDTEALTTVLWSDLLYGTCPDEVRRGAEKRCRGYALYLLLDIDVPFAPDPQRCFPDEEDRRKCMKIWHGALERRGLPYIWIRGEWAERERTAIAAVAKLLA